MRKVILTGAFFCACVQASGARADTSLLPKEMAPDTATLERVATPGIQSPEQLIPFAEAASQMRLTGEYDTRRLSFYLAPDQVAKAGALRIAYTNAVSVLPDGATLSVSLNGHAVSSLPIRSPQGITRRISKWIRLFSSRDGTR